MSTATEYYDKTAAQYDALRTNELEHTLALEIVWPLIGGEVHSVLDVGCGTGRGLYWLAQRYPTLELHGIEPSEGMIAIATKKLAGVDIRRGIGEHLPFQDESIEVVTATGIMHHADNPTLVISEMFRVARKAVAVGTLSNILFSQGHFALVARKAAN